MSNTQFAWLIVPPWLLVMMMIGNWIHRRLKHWSSKLRYDCTAHVHGLQVQMDALQRGQERLLNRIEGLKQHS